MRKLKLLGIITFLIVGQLAGTVAIANEAVTSREERAQILKKEDLNEIVYGADNAKAVIYVFTDLNCGYCRKLHHDIVKLNKLGVQLKVLAMPRQGIGSPGYTEMVSVWCSDDPKVAMSRAMDGETIAPKTCKNPVKEHFGLAKEWGVMGTPTIVFADGTLKPGYSSADKLAREAIQRSGHKEE